MGQDAIREDRRPGLAKIVERLRKANPRMSEAAAICQAKQLWTDEYNARKEKSNAQR